MAEKKFKIDVAEEIFNLHLKHRKEGVFDSDHHFRQTILIAYETALDVSRASASAMYNTCKKRAEFQDPLLMLGRIPDVV